VHAVRGTPAVVLEADQLVGGLARTVCVDGFRFDLGGHRFYTKIEPVQQLWETMLGPELLTRQRLSRIYYDGKLFSYPLRAQDVTARLGVGEAALCALSYLGSQRPRRRRPDTFEEWVTARFGRRLYDAFFRSYTEKVWGVPGSEIRSQWAAQRIRNFSLFRAILSIAGIRQRNVVTLIEEFEYPRLGPGQMWEAFRDFAACRNVATRLGHRVIGLRHSGQRVESVVVQTDREELELSVDAVVSSLPIAELVLGLDPAPPAAVAAAAAQLRHRDLCLVALMLEGELPFEDNWIYLHDPGVRAARVQNFGAWSESMVPPGSSCLGVEYFCFRGDDLWELGEEEAVAFAAAELGRIGLIDPARVFGGSKVTVPNAYPMYDRSYEQAVAVLRRHLAGFSNLQTCGRNGLHRYNNQDHSMWTAALATVNILDGGTHDIWAVNGDPVYLEELVRAAPGVRSGLDRIFISPTPVAVADPV
jgi:protoporphyrinogen oxidase